MFQPIKSCTDRCTSFKIICRLIIRKRCRENQVNQVKNQDGCRHDGRSGNFEDIRHFGHDYRVPRNNGNSYHRKRFKIYHSKRKRDQQEMSATSMLR